ncbi:M43 family zinc metalloprotease [Sediminibacter sp. Hel_I_10]|uniref:M43 family zinc metalloprotease n=1 Tax=Sediminibacter sp. Hel_I_10 TaxID=1392490 RepID=UPI00047EDA31|nr:M43 family zinc metalloprotease [Sediminibacter sp. Hel_I_10]
MNKNTLFFFFLLFIFGTVLINAQEKTNFFKNLPEPVNGIIKCASDEYNTQLLKQYPEMMGSERFEETIQQRIQQISNTNERRLVVRLPIVVHVVHAGEPIGINSNISEAQVLSQIQVLNEDYRKLEGTNGFNTDPLGADTEIEFFLAQEDPDCNPTNGIHRVLRSSLPNGGGDIDSDIKPATIWDSSKYINMWVLQLGGGLLGYAQFPGGDPMTDGVVMGYQYFGSNDAAGVNIGGVYNLGRTTTHELGHYLGLLHTFQGGCGPQGDLVADTPFEAGPNYGCPSVIPDTCPAATGDDPIENYMDYSDDACMNIFTNGQNSRIQAVLSTSRSGLVSSDVPEIPLPEVSYDASLKILGFDDVCGSKVPNVQLTNYGTEELTSATINYSFNEGASTTLNWTGSIAQGVSTIINLPQIDGPLGVNILDASVIQTNTDQRVCNDSDSSVFEITEVTEVGAENLFFSITTDDYSDETVWEFTNGSGEVVASGGPYNGTSEDNTIFTATIPINEGECYSFVINDAASDGICCLYGLGSFELRENDIDGNIIFEGGNFDSQDNFSFVANTLGVNDYFSNNDMYLFPNPSNNFVEIKLSNTINLPDSFEIINMLGQSISKRTIRDLSDLNIDASNFSNGVYFIKLTKEQSFNVLRLVKQ